MAEVLINLKIPAPKNQQNKAVKAFVRQRPNPDPRNMNDRKWMQKWCRDVLNEQINFGQIKLDEEARPPLPPPDPDIVENESGVIIR